MKRSKSYSMSCRILGLLLFILPFSIVSSVTSSTKVSKHHSVDSPKTPLLFEQNQGQFNKSVDYVARGRGYSIVLAQQPVIELYRFRSTLGHSAINQDDASLVGREIEEVAKIKLNILDAKTSVPSKPLEKQLALTHYLMGQEEDWHADVPNFKRVRYEGILNHIDVEYYGQDGRLEYDFIVNPGGDPGVIKIRFEGATRVSLNEQGDLVINLDGERIIQKAPVSYQLDNKGKRINLASSYTLVGGTVGFQVTDWDSEKSLVIDPVLEYSRYYGGVDHDLPFAVDLDAENNIYVFGVSNSVGLATMGSFQENGLLGRKEVPVLVSCGDCVEDAGPSGQIVRYQIVNHQSFIITKFTPDGTTVLYSTYFSAGDANSATPGINSAAVSSAGEVAFGITTAGAGLPLVNSTQSYSDTVGTVYVAKLNSAGNGLIFGTYLQTGNGWLRGLDVSPTGEVAVSGFLDEGNNFPEVNKIPGQSCTLGASNGNWNDPDWSDGYVILFDAMGDVTFASCLGGETGNFSTEGFRGVAIGSGGDLYVVGYSSMTDFPMVNPIQDSPGVTDARDLTISRIDPDTGTLLFSTYFGPKPSTNGFFTRNLFPMDIRTDSGGNIIVTGSVKSLSYPTINAFQSNLRGPRDSADYEPFFSQNRPLYESDIFVTKLHPDHGVIFSTYLGGSRYDGGRPALAVDADDNVYISTTTDSDNFPLLNPIQASLRGDSSLVVSKFSPNGALAFSTYLGGSDDQARNAPSGVAVNGEGQIVVVGLTASDDFPTTGVDANRPGGWDISLSIIDQSGDMDTDGDGVPDSVDVFMEDPSEWRDIDGDLIGDNSDTDDDGDKEPDASDRFPNDGSEQSDADEDGVGDNLDQFDADQVNYFDLDNDGLADLDSAELDSDGDGTDNAGDAFKFNASENTDSDMDGIGNNADLDDDGDLTPDIMDPASLDFDIPVYNFEQYDVSNSTLFKSPWPAGFSEVEAANLAWTSATDQSYSGSRSFTSRVISDDQVAAIQFADDFKKGVLQFWYKVDSEKGFDQFSFSIDSDVLLTESGDTGWRLFSAPVSSGVHTFEWRYAKDDSKSVGDDAAWIDDVQFINTIPDKPTLVRASDGSFPDRIRVTFNPVAGATVYRVFRCQDNGNTCGTPIAYPKAGIFDDKNAIPGVIYYYRVKACTSVKCGKFSSADTGYIRTEPAAPTGVNASDGIYVKRVQLNWNKVDDATVYRVYRCSDGGQSCGAPIGYPKTTTFNDFNGIPGEVYYYRIKACATNCSVFSSADTGFGNEQLNRPTGIRATDGLYQDRVEVTFNTVDGATVYRVFRCLDTDQTCSSPIGYPKVGFFSDHKGDPGTVYYYRVRACTSDNCGLFSVANAGNRAVAALTEREES